MAQTRMNPVLAVIAMINGMIGGLILVLPILTMQGGSVLSCIVIVATGFFSYYSCFLCIQHLGNHSDLDKSIFFHFWKSKAVKIFYDFMVCINLIFILLLYFNLIVQQWEGLVKQSIANPICNAVWLLILVCILKYVHFGAQLLGYGIISIVLYCVFLIWLVSSAPSGPKTIPLFGKGAVNLAASMGQAFSIQTFFIPVLRQLPKVFEANYGKYTLYAYIIGGLVYLYIAYAGAFGIVNRTLVQPKLETIQDYFRQDQWEVSIVQAIYLVHLYSAYGQFLLVSKKRFFGILGTLCGVRHSKQGQFFTVPQFIYILVIIVATVGVYFAGVSIQNLIEINGAVIGFFFIYLIPALMHFKCCYLTPKKPLLQLKHRVTQDFGNKQLELTERNQSIVIKKSLIQQTQGEQKIQQSKPKQGEETVQENNKKLQMVAQKPQQKGGSEQQQIKAQSLNIQCNCSKPKHIALQILDIICVFVMIIMGLFILVDGIISVIRGTS